MRETLYVPSRVNRLPTRLRAMFDPAPIPKDPGVLMRRAMRDTGLKNFGDPIFLEGFHQLHRSFLESNNLSTAGKLLAGGLFEINLRNRLLIEEACTKHPEITNEKVEAPLFIIGFPRSGSTLLQRLLATDARLHHLTYAEGLMPAPPPGLSSEGHEERMKQAKDCNDTVKRLTPELWKKHSTEPEEPEECYTLMRNTFMDVTFAFMTDLMPYLKWYRNQDMAIPYREHKRQLQILQAGRPEKRWILKAPSHTQRWRAIRRVYPDAKFIVTHRDPCEVIPSVASLICTIRAAYCNTGLTLQERLPKSFQSTMNQVNVIQDLSENLPAEQVLHVRYPDFIQDPLDTLGRVLDFAGMSYPEETRQAFGAYLETHPKNEHGAHTYSLEGTPITENEIQSTFQDYMKTYGFPTN